MQNPCFFGYGSLVNRQTHSYPNAAPATLQGWRRTWVGARERDDVAYLTAVRDPAAQIQGLIAEVPDGDWSALDTREAGYARCDATPGLSPSRENVAVYAVQEADFVRHGAHVILLSYLDVVIQGYAQVFGASGVAAFFDTTTGWDIPILDDRTAPRYPRTQRLTNAETALVDSYVTKIGRVIAP